MTKDPAGCDRDGNRDVVLMFSGGRDSSLAACLYALQHRFAHLTSFETGLGVRGDIAEFRVRELRARFPAYISERTVVPIFGLVRKIATANLEDDFREFDGYNLILLGEKLAMFAASIAIARERGAASIADGTSDYQSEMPEQTSIALQMLRAYASHHGLTYETPILGRGSEDDVKYTLFELGISTKSLEGATMFADSFSAAPSEVISRYIAAKMPLLDEHIALLSGDAPQAVGEASRISGEPE